MEFGVTNMNMNQTNDGSGYFTVKPNTRTAKCSSGQCSLTPSGKNACVVSFSRGGYPSGTCY
ncbi:hypothetical protein JDV02_002502 [Purpureocillium takamizusanense]|uniref:Uncharacterized protein n=1 Tax=Purpureocillium takamizusanense TaxID=2060973 RepID=A0A9Q8V7H7_9HYPO|nr:uncharacterized protein JDV02_002502 [Purpureocillium takamizusanense]UNI16025.1 hypothetical protein JDV02_002502 [Purpureocillium takamizusanense]